MSDDDDGSAKPEHAKPKGRAVGSTEHSWCRAVPGGTGITVLALLLSKPPDLSLIRTAIHNLQHAHPILRCKLHYNPATRSFSLLTHPSNSPLRIQSVDLTSTDPILQVHACLPPLHMILEHELNNNTWRNLEACEAEISADVFHASVYALEGARWAAVLRLHTAVCDRAAAVGLLRELLGELGGAEREIVGREGEVGLGIEELIPNGKANKALWARGVDLLGYSLNSLRLANLKFVDAKSPRSSQAVRLQLDPDETGWILLGCKTRGIKVCGALAAAGLIAAHSSKQLEDKQWEKYAVVTLMDCRSILHPVLPANHPGFYHSAILNTHDMRGGETLWELATRTYTAFANAKNCNKHFSDMADINFLMCRAIENPGLTPSSSLRTAFISVFEESVIDDFDETHRRIGLEDYMGCSSVHGVGPSIAVFDTVRDGRLDCICVYPSPLHSREQMREFVENMKRVLRDGGLICGD